MEAKAYTLQGFQVIFNVSEKACTMAKEHHIEESKGALQFASRAKHITNYAQLNEITLRGDTLDIKEADYYESLYKDRQAEFNTLTTLCSMDFPFLLLLVPYVPVGALMKLFFYMLAVVDTPQRPKVRWFGDEEDLVGDDDGDEEVNIVI
ncbi:unnamed protein product [Arabis nemorensis]|uniref:Uncharacterized protein n=1 Tax=Arabis nemorensis TaxID=586526 RepID=A0A565CG28_9BRAS|nr:unnamed protein product [Arabis nemorensis]